MRVVLSTWGKFHSFHLARQMERFGWLDAIFTTYPRFHLWKEGIAAEKILANPWLHFPLIAKWRLGLHQPALDREWIRLTDLSQQRFIAKRMPSCDVFIALSGSGLSGGRIVQARGGKWICDRSSAHIAHTDDLLEEEFLRFGVAYRRSDPWTVEKELSEYREADLIAVPSQFARRSFVARGVEDRRLAVVPLGSDVERFRRVSDPDPSCFTVLYVGQIGFRKGIPHLIEAFRRVRHRNKRLLLVGSVLSEIRPYLESAPLENVEFLGSLTRDRLAEVYSRAHAFAIASVEDGWGMVQTEAMACGVAVVSSENTGAADCIVPGVNGYVVPIRDPAAMAEKLQTLADDPLLCAEMGAQARRTVEQLGGWDAYGDRFRELCLELRGDVAMVESA